MDSVQGLRTEPTNLSPDHRRQEGNKCQRMETRHTMLKLACGIAGLFILGMIIAQESKEERPDLSSHYFHDMSINERQHFSSFNWNEVKKVNLQLHSEESGMVSIRAINGEIIYQAFLESEIPEEIQIDVPSEFKNLLIEYHNTVENVRLADEMIALEI